jgi:hypothetical protein
LSRKRLYAEDRGLQVPMSLEHRPVTSSDETAPGTDSRIRHRIQIVMFRSIRVDHTNCLQVTIKTHSFRKVFKYPPLDHFSFLDLNYLQYSDEVDVPRSVTHSTEQWVWYFIHIRSMLLYVICLLNVISLLYVAICYMSVICYGHVPNIYRCMIT